MSCVSRDGGRTAAWLTAAPAPSGKAGARPASRPRSIAGLQDLLTREARENARRRRVHRSSEGERRPERFERIETVFRIVLFTCARKSEDNRGPVSILSKL